MSNFPNFMALYGARLADNCWPAIPIEPGEKHPATFSWGQWTPADAWQERFAAPPTDADLAEWVEWPGCGVGICCGYIVGVDIDITEPAAALAAENTARRMLGDTPLVRIGNYPKRMLVYKADAPFPSFNGVDIQILAAGRQFVAFGIHPNTRKPYEWLADSPADIASDAIPTITEAQARAYIAAVAPKKGAEAAPASRPQQSGMGQRGTLEAITDALQWVQNPDLHYDDWIKIGLAIKGALGEAGRDLWLNWSAQSAKDNSAYTARKWDHDFRNSISGAGTIYHLAERAGWRPGSHLILNGDIAEIMISNPAAGLLAAAEARAAAQVAPAPPRTKQSEFMKLDGALARMVGEIVASSPTSPQPFLALAASLAAVGTLMGRRYSTKTGLRSNIYAVGLAASGGGKNHARKWIRQALMESGLKDYLGPEEIASAQAIMTALGSHAALLFQIDEMGKKMEEMLSKKASTHKAAIWSKFTELYSQSDGWVMGTAYANIKDRPREDIAQPCACIYATTVPAPFWKSLDGGAMMDGSLARWLVFVPETQYPDDPEVPPPPLTISPAVKKSLAAIVKGAQGHDYGGNLALGMSANIDPIPYQVPETPEAEKARHELRKEQLKWQREAEGGGSEAIIARFAENSAKIALIRAVSYDPERPIIRLSDVEYAASLVKYCVESTFEGAGSSMADSDAERVKKRVLEIVKSAGPGGILGNALTRKTQFLRGQRERDDIIGDLQEAGMVSVVIQPTGAAGGRPTRIITYLG